MIWVKRKMEEKGNDVTRLCGSGEKRGGRGEALMKNQRTSGQKKKKRRRRRGGGEGGEQDLYTHTGAASKWAAVFADQTGNQPGKGGSVLMYLLASAYKSLAGYQMEGGVDLSRWPAALLPAGPLGRHNHSRLVCSQRQWGEEEGLHGWSAAAAAV